MKSKLTKTPTFSSKWHYGVALCTFAFLVLLALVPAFAQQKKTKRITGVRLGTASRVSVSSDSALNDYEAFRRGDRFHVRIPAANFVASQPLFRGSGFQEVQVQKIGDSVVISFWLKPGASAHVVQRSNKLDVVFASASGNANPATADNSVGAARSRSGTQAESQPPSTSSPDNTRSDAGTSVKPAAGSASPQSPNSERSNSSASATSSSPAISDPTTATASATPSYLNPSNPPATSSESPSTSSTESPVSAKPSRFGWRNSSVMQWYRLNKGIAIAVAILVLMGIALLTWWLISHIRQRRRALPKVGRKVQKKVRAKELSKPKTDFSVPPVVVPAFPNVEAKEEETVSVAKPTAKANVPRAPEPSTAPRTPTPAPFFPLARSIQETPATAPVAQPVSHSPEAKELNPEPFSSSSISYEQAETEVRKLLSGSEYNARIVDSKDTLSRQVVAAALLSAITSRNTEQIETARQAYMEHGYFDETTHDLRTADSVAQRCAAARNLGLVASTSGTPHLIAALHDSAPEVRRAAVESMGQIGDPDAVPALNELLLRENSRQVPEAVIRHAINSIQVTEAKHASPSERPNLQVVEKPRPAPDSDESDAFNDFVERPKQRDASLPLTEALLPQNPPHPGGLRTPDPSLQEEEVLRRAAEELEARKREAEIVRLKAEKEAQFRLEVDARMRAEEEARSRADLEAQLRAEIEVRLHAEEEARRRAADGAAQRVAGEDAGVRAEQEEPVRSETAARFRLEEEARFQIEAQTLRRAAEELARKRASEAARPSAEEETHLNAEEQMRDEVEVEIRRRAEEDEGLRTEAELKRRVEERGRLRDDIEPRLQYEEEQRLKAEDAARRLAEEMGRQVEEQQRLEEDRLKREAEERRFVEVRRLQMEQEALAQAAAELVRRRSEIEESRRKAEEEAKVLAETRARLQAEEEAARRRIAEIREQLEADNRRGEEERRRLEEARLRVDETKRRIEEDARRQAAEEEQRLPIEAEKQRRLEVEGRLREEQTPQQLEEEARRQVEEEARRLAEEARHGAEERARLTNELQQPEEEVPRAEHQAEDANFALSDQPETAKASDVELASFATHNAAEKSIDLEVSEESEADLAWVNVSLERNEHVDLPVVTDQSEPEAVTTVAGVPVTERIDVVREEEPITLQDDESRLPAELIERLNAQESSERAAALADLASFGGDEAFHHISNAFDDQSPDTRNAAARALFSLHQDRAASFTRALREGTPERRRRIAAALSDSGIASDAIENLTGESREKTYDAFSLLFLMAKAGEVLPLMKAIEDHPNIEVRLAVVKLLALSGQPDIVPAFRRLAVSGSLPSEVRSAVMEAIYQISTQSRETTSSAA